MSRERVALTQPPADLAAFPVVAGRDHDGWRAHTSARDPWWFSSAGGRFDLPAPHGTCYMASDTTAAVRERLGETLAAARRISGDDADRMVVSYLHFSADLADTTSNECAEFGVTRELGTITPYALPQRWAAALFDAGFGGVRCWLRSSPGNSCATALFGDAGPDESRPVDRAPLNGRAAARQAGLAVIDLPRTLPVVEPPRS